MKKIFPDDRNTWFAERTDIVFCLLGHITFLGLLAASMVFYRERLHGNAGQDIFTMINEGRFFLIHGRLTHIFSQWMPLLAVKAGASLKTVLLLYSISTMLTFYLIFIFLLHVLKKPHAALGILMIPFFGSFYSFYHDPHLEIQFCMALSIMVYAMIDSDRLTPVAYLSVMAILFGLIILSYPPTVIFILCVICMKWPSISRQRLMVLAGLLITILFIGYFSLDPYESSVLDYSLKDDQPFHYFNILTHFMGYFLFGHILEVAFGLIIMVIVYRIGARMVALPALLFFMAYASLIVVFYGNNYQFEYKSIPLMFFIIILTVALLEQSKPALARKVTIMASILIFTSAIRIFNAHSDFKDQTQQLTKMIYELECRENQLILVKDAENVFSHSSFQMSLFLSGIDKQNDGVGILFEHILIESMMSWKVPLDIEKINQLKASSNTDELLSLVVEYYRSIPLHKKYFPIKNESFILVSINNLCSN